MSRKVYMYILKNRTMSQVISKFEQFLDEADCNIINSDDEFNNKPFRSICEKNHITLNTIVAADEHIH